MNGVSHTQLNCLTAVLSGVIPCVLFRINTYVWLLSLYIVFRYVLLSALPFTQVKVKSIGQSCPTSHRDGVLSAAGCGGA